MLVINDLHLGVSRAGGTTPQSQAALREYLRGCVSNLLDEYPDEHVVVNGDLFDGFQVDTSEVIKAYTIFSKHKGLLTFISGNHDESAKGDKVSSFHLLCHFMKEVSDKFTVIDHNSGLTNVDFGVWAISHCLNQDAFDAEIAKAIKMDIDGAYLLLHCNYKNGFAENSDHSLNLSDDQVGDLMRAGWNLVLGHEHQGYSLRGGRVVVVGNQFPSSVADCIGDEEKHALVIADNGSRQFVPTWSRYDSYIEVDWRDMPDLDGHQFIRVVGEATALEAADVIKTVSKLRQSHDGYVISNAVRIEGRDLSDNTDSIESIKAFDLMGAILSELSEQEQETLKELLK